MKCPKCHREVDMCLEPITSDDGQFTIYAVVCEKCEAPIHFQASDGQLGNMAHQVQQAAKALNSIAEAIEKKNA